VTTVVNFLLTRMTFIPCTSKLMVTSKFPHATRTSNREMWQKLKSKYSTQILAMEMQVPPQETHMEKEREREREREEWVVLYCKNANSENKSHINAKPQQ
jgi:hypothetical protein